MQGLYHQQYNLGSRGLNNKNRVRVHYTMVRTRDRRHLQLRQINLQLGGTWMHASRPLFPGWMPPPDTEPPMHHRRIEETVVWISCAVLKDGYTPEQLTIQLSIPATPEEALQAVQAARDPTVRTLFRQLYLCSHNRASAQLCTLPPRRGVLAFKEHASVSPDWTLGFMPRHCLTMWHAMSSCHSSTTVGIGNYSGSYIASAYPCSSLSAVYVPTLHAEQRCCYIR